MKPTDISWTAPREGGDPLDRVFLKLVTTHTGSKQDLVRLLIHEFKRLADTRDEAHLRGTIQRKLSNLNYYRHGPGYGNHGYSKGMAHYCRELGIAKHPNALRCGRYSTD